MPLTAALHAISVWASDFLRSARAAGWDAREETITEQLLVALHQYPAATTRVFKVGQHQESLFGPDFLWAIQRDGLWLSLWVQSKKASGTAFLQYAEFQKPEA